MNQAIEFIEVEKQYGETHVVKRLNLGIGEGQLVTLIGPSGCGKTTTLKMINRLIEPTAGEIYVGGENTNRLSPVELRRKIGYVIQQIGLFPHMTIEENIGLVPKLMGIKKHEYARRAESLLDMVGMDPSVFRTRYPKELSGGQQQRIGVARALAADPDIILMDEPFSALDPISREQLQEELLKLQGALHKTIVFVTHDMDEALKIADQIVLMKDGTIVQHGIPDQILRHPKNDFVREFVGEKRFFQNAAFGEAREAMTEAVTVAPIRGLAHCVQQMKRHRVNGLIVTDAGGRYLGVVSPQQIYDHFRDEQATAASVMRDDGPTVNASAPMDQVLGLLQSDARGFLPVVDADERLLGVITRASVLNVLTAFADEEVSAGGLVDSNV
ncbi:betaine/proline/choline family ABC transporter ATP-binding protein [Alicyclobacillus fastidiosus]|uniref:Quaternary amine transport ATP-binding protein n=1 Tax=Alicyclobacillus fastidiosus TaxID=392011 RepID=A0ABV5ABS3_9BACL|nr:betaine/proline/choline family ABC transporter ATP-binding protein [Alicyclobacillus fastidiosus]WEH10391.1 betaine/proline/choline family ABC transporter ATP-binding protein [Alicyclobacillus fastidiosus]